MSEKSGHESKFEDFGHLRTYEIISLAKEYVDKYYRTNDLKYLNTPKLYEKLRVAARRWAIRDLSRNKRLENPENYIDIVAHESVANLYSKIVTKEVDLELFSYYYKTVIRHKIYDVFRESVENKHSKYGLHCVIEDVENLEEFSYEEEISELLYIRDKSKLLLKYIKNSLKSETLTENIAHLLIFPILLCVIRDNTVLVDNYPFRLRVFLRKVIYEARTVYVRDFLKR